MPEFKPTHHHFKGGLYEFLYEATLEATMEKVVVYRGHDMRVWIRPTASFFQDVGNGVCRFEALSEDRSFGVGHD